MNSKIMHTWGFLLLTERAGRVEHDQHPDHVHGQIHVGGIAVGVLLAAAGDVTLVDHLTDDRIRPRSRNVDLGHGVISGSHILVSSNTFVLTFSSCFSVLPRQQKV